MNGKEYGFVLRPEMCIQCHACEAACRNWRKPESVNPYRKVIAVERGSFPNTRISYYSLGCMHCAEPECAAACPMSAITKRDDGTVIVDRELCIGCGACADACPYGIPRFTEDGRMEKCDLCAAAPVPEQRGICARMCPTHALVFTELTPDEKKEQEKKLPVK